MHFVRYRVCDWKGSVQTRDKVTEKVTDNEETAVLGGENDAPWKPVFISVTGLGTFKDFENRYGAKLQTRERKKEAVSCRVRSQHAHVFRLHAAGTLDTAVQPDRLRHLREKMIAACSW